MSMPRLTDFEIIGTPHQITLYEYSNGEKSLSIPSFTIESAIIAQNYAAALNKAAKHMEEPAQP